MLVIYVIAWEIIIVIIQPVTKTNYLLLWRHTVKLISVLNRSANQVGRTGSKHYRLAMFKIQKRVLTFVSYF